MINQTFYPAQAIDDLPGGDPFAPGNIELSAEQIRGISPAQKKTTKPRKANEPPFVQFFYENQLELADRIRNCLMAVQAEIYHLYFKSWDKTQPIELGNKVLQSLRFDNKQKKKALEDLESVGWIKVEWRKNQSPLITPLAPGFKLSA
jgi:hypothetical protein